MIPSHKLAFNLFWGSQKKLKSLNRCFIFFAMSIVSAVLHFVKEKDNTTTFLQMGC